MDEDVDASLKQQLSIHTANSLNACESVILPKSHAHRGCYSNDCLIVEDYEGAGGAVFELQHY